MTYSRTHETKTTAESSAMSARGPRVMSTARAFGQRGQAVGEFEQQFHALARGRLTELFDNFLQGRGAAIDLFLRQRIHGQALSTVIN
mgnify:CR=1 FL=1